MQQFRWWDAAFAVSACLLLPAAVSAAQESQIRREDFSKNPAGNGWSIFGDSSLFTWSASSQDLHVTWDSSRPNSYFRLPLETLLTRHDDFSVELDFSLSDITPGATEGKPGTFQLAFGFQNRSDAMKQSFIRGTGDKSPNLVEFNFFPDTGYGPTIWRAIFPTNGMMNYTGAGDLSIFDLPTEVPMHILLQYTSGNETASILITTNGVPVGPLTDAPLSSKFTAFQVDTFAISSYSDAGQSPFMPGSILAHGAVDNIVITTPPPPIRAEQSTMLEGHWQHSFLSLTNWLYTLQASTNLSIWADVGTSAQGTGSRLTLIDAQPQASIRFYRVAASRLE